MTRMSEDDESDNHPVVSWTCVSVKLGSYLALENIDLRLDKCDFVAILGPNGAGKSTLLRAMAGIIPSLGGAKARFRPIAGLTGDERKNYFAYLSQDREISWPMPVRDVVAMGLDDQPGATIKISRNDAALMAEILWECGLERLTDRPVNSLSGGERSRVLLARALLSRAPVLLVDEPTAALDPAGQIKILELLAARARSGRPVIAVLHDVALATRFATRAILLERGRKVADDAPKKVILSKAMTKAFGIVFHLYETMEGPALALSKPRPEDFA